MSMILNETNQIDYFPFMRIPCGNHKQINRHMKKLTIIVSSFLIALSFSSCVFDHSFCMVGSGPIVTREFDLASFNAVIDQTVVDVEIVQGDEQKIVAEGHENIMDQLDMAVSGEELEIDLRHGSYSSFKMKIYITVPTLESVIINSTGDVKVGGFKNLKSIDLISNSTGDLIVDGLLEVDEELLVKNRSTGDIDINVNAREINTVLSSTGDVKVRGNCNRQSVELSSTGDYNAYGLNSDDCSVETSGTGDAFVTVSDELDVVIRSLGDVHYKGSPRVSISDNSLGDLISVN